MTIRFKLIMLAIVVILAANLLLALVGVQYVGRVWMDEIQDRVRLSLNSAEVAFENHGLQSLHFLEAAALDSALTRAVAERDDEAAEKTLDRVFAAGRLDFITLLDRDGNVRYRPANPSCRDDHLGNISLVKQAIASDSALSGTILISAEQLARERPELANRARFRLLPTPAARPTEDIERTDGMLMASVAPILDDQRVIVGYLFGGHLLNRRNDVVDKIKSEVFAGETFEYEDVGTVTIFQEDLRIATNVLDDDGLRAVGTRLSDPVYRDVLQQGRVWSAPAFVVNEWYITAYGPVRDPNDRVIGALYVGLRRAPFVHRRNAITTAFLAAVLVSTIVILGLLLIVTNWVLYPMRRLLNMCRRVTHGDLAARVGVQPPGELGVLCTAVDEMAGAIEERERKLEQATQQQIGRSEKLASIGRLAAGIAHEINNPLTGILTFAHLLRDRHPDGDQDREDLDLIIHETQRAAEVVQGLLDFARERPTTKVPLDINTVIGRIVRLVENQKEMRLIHIEQDFGENLPDILGDANQLQQVFLNLFLNAAAAMVDGGILTITTRAADDTVTISVTDNGSGIAPENLDKIFDPFFTTKPVGQGTGLGLSVSYGIIEQHGGSIEVSSELEIGSTFLIHLPVDTQTACKILEESEINDE